jgi:hypothetical protein
MSQSVRLVGWASALVSMIMILWEISNIASNPMDQILMIEKMFPQTTGGTNDFVEMFQYDRLWSIYSLVYFLLVLTGSIEFLRFKVIGRVILEIACWVGMLNACIDTLRSYYLWKQMQAVLSSVSALLGSSAGAFFPLGTATIVLGFLLWTVPTGGMLVYLRKPALRALMK